MTEVKADAKFTGDGTIEKAIVSAKDDDFSKKPNDVSTAGYVIVLLSTGV